MEFHEIIDDKLWIGGQPSKDDLLRLHNKLGSAMIVMDLTRNEEEEKTCLELGIEYDERTPEIVLSPDNSIPIGKLKVVSAIIGDNIDSGKKVLVHCSLGKGRSPTCAAAYFMSSGLSLQETIELLSRKGFLFVGADSNYARSLADLSKIIEMTRG